MADLAPTVLWPTPEPDWAQLNAAGLTIARREDLAAVSLQLTPSAQPLLVLPGAGRFDGADDAVTLWQGPREWLFLTTEPTATLAALARDIDRQGWYGLVSDSLLVLDIAGPFAVLLARGCALDPQSLVVGSCAVTRFAGLHVAVAVLSTDRLRLIADAADAAYLHAWCDHALGDIAG